MYITAVNLSSSKSTFTLDFSGSPGPVVLTVKSINTVNGISVLEEAGPEVSRELEHIAANIPASNGQASEYKGHDTAKKNLPKLKVMAEYLEE